MVTSEWILTEAVGLNRMRDPPSFFTHYFRNMGKTKIIDFAILVKSLDSRPAFYYFSFSHYIKIKRTIFLWVVSANETRAPGAIRYNFNSR